MQSAADDHVRLRQCFDELFEVLFPVQYAESLILDSRSGLYLARKSHVVVVFAFAFGDWDIHDFISLIVEFLYIFDDFRKELFRILIEIDRYEFLVRDLGCRFLDFSPIVGEVRCVHEKSYFIESIFSYFVNGFHIPCEDVFRPSEDGREEYPVESFLRHLDPSHDIPRLPQAGEDRCKPVPIGIPVLFRDDFPSSDDDGISFPI